MDRREQLLTHANRFLQYVNKPDTDTDKLSRYISRDLVTQLAYPGEPSGYEGLKNLIAKLHGALHDYSLTVLSSMIDEKQNKVVFFVKSSGVQAG